MDRGTMENERKITLQTEEGEDIDLFVLEETRIGGADYLLVTDEEDEDADGTCYILKDTSRRADAEAVYQFVEDDSEAEDLLKIFSQLLDGEDVELQK